MLVEKEFLKIMGEKWLLDSEKEKRERKCG